jgi:hypothetical protein
MGYHMLYYIILLMMDKSSHPGQMFVTLILNFTKCEGVYLLGSLVLYTRE